MVLAAANNKRTVGCETARVASDTLPFDEAGLVSQVRVGDYAHAIVYCEEALAASAPPAFWRRQLAYCLFLDERGPVANQWERAPAVFDQLVRDEPDDPDLRFWRGYLLKVVLVGYDELGMNELRRALDLDPNHPYANLVLAAYEDPPQSIAFVQRTLSSQPNNYRALRFLAGRLAQAGRNHDAQEVLAIVLRDPPYIDIEAPVILRDYVNGVLTGAHWADQSRDEVTSELAAARPGDIAPR